MEALLDSIRIAVSDGASDDERRRGVVACRAVADALEGALVADATAPPPSVPASEIIAYAPMPELVALVPAIAHPLAANPFAGLTPDQILELAIAKLRGAVGEDIAPPPAGQPFRLTLVPVPRHS